MERPANTVPGSEEVKSFLDSLEPWIQPRNLVEPVCMLLLKAARIIVQQGKEIERLKAQPNLAANNVQPGTRSSLPEWAQGWIRNLEEMIEIIGSQRAELKTEIDRLTCENAELRAALTPPDLAARAAKNQPPQSWYDDGGLGDLTTS